MPQLLQLGLPALLPPLLPPLLKLLVAPALRLGKYV